jgi:DNA-directed RNA polymerase specialized sigma24 family protein
VTGHAPPYADLSRRLRALCRIADPARQVTAATELLEDLRVAELTVSQVRDVAIVRLSESGRTYQEIAAVAGLTRGRVAQVVQRVRRAAR